MDIQDNFFQINLKCEAGRGGTYAFLGKRFWHTLTQDLLKWCQSIWRGFSFQPVKSPRSFTAFDDVAVKEETLKDAGRCWEKWEDEVLLRTAFLRKVGSEREFGGECGCISQGPAEGQNHSQM